MKVSIFKLPGGRMDALVEATIGNGKPPVLLKDVTGLDIQERLAPVIREQRGPRQPTPGSGG